MQFHEIEFDQQKFQKDLNKMILELQKLELAQVDNIVEKLAVLGGVNNSV